MRLDFNVLWVDDQPNRVDAQIKSIRRKMEDEGFDFNATLARSLAEVQESVGDSVFADQIDLILVDWDLGGQLQGQDAIAAIRESVPYKDIVFYSARNPVDELRRLAFEKGVEGIYCASRENLVEEVLGVFESLVKKVLDIDHTRGIVMGATSDIDNIVNECLVAIDRQLDEVGRSEMLDRALGYVEKRIKALNKTATSLKDAASWPDFLAAHMIFTSNDRLRVLAGALGSRSQMHHHELRRSVVTYLQKVVPQRNHLGHAVLVPDGKALTLTDIRGRVISLEETRSLRRLILSLRSDFRRLLSGLEVGLTSDTA